jgi:tetratricopeptide (TPR) repeat protein
MNVEFWRHALRGRLYRLLRRRDDALTQYQAALKHDPRSVRTHHTIAFLLAGQKRYREAEPHLRETLRLQPKNASAWFNLGFLYDQQQGEPQKAIDAFREAVRLDPKLDRAWYGLGLCLASLGDHQEASTALQHVTRLQSSNGFAWYHLGMAYHALGMNDKVTEVVHHLNRFERKLARQLIQNTQRTDLQHLIADLRV